jgi:hypothetical protein
MEAGNSVLTLQDGVPVDSGLMRTWLGQFVNVAPNDPWRTVPRKWYAGTVAPGDIGNLWINLTSWTTPWVQGVPDEQATVNVIVDRWSQPPASVGHDHIDRIDALRQDFSRFKESDPRNWIVVTDDIRNAQTGLLIRDGNHRAIAAKLAGLAKMYVFLGISPGGRVQVVPANASSDFCIRWAVLSS